MQDAFVGSWAQESHLTIERLGSLRELNHRFLDLTAAPGRRMGRLRPGRPVAGPGRPGVAVVGVAAGGGCRPAPMRCSICAFKTRDIGGRVWRTRVPGAWRMTPWSRRRYRQFRAVGPVLRLARCVEPGLGGSIVTGHERRHGRRLPPHHGQSPARTGGERGGESVGKMERLHGLLERPHLSRIARRPGGAAPGSAVRLADRRGRTAAVPLVLALSTLKNGRSVDWRCGPGLARFRLRGSL